MPFYMERGEHFVSYKYSHFKSMHSLLYSALLISTFRLILCSQEHFQSSGCAPLWPAAEHLTHVGRNIVPLDGKRIPTLLVLSVPSTTHASIAQMDGHANVFTGTSVLMCTSLKGPTAFLMSFDWVFDSHSEKDLCDSE
jgi:hypothetical protein